MIRLLDVNVLIALIDADHVHHDLAHDWFGRHAAGGWATCPLTQNGVLRIVGSRAYVNSPGSPAVVADILRGLVRRPGHVFWPDDISLTQTDRFRPDHIGASHQITDLYLLGLAVHHGGRLATLDRRIDATGVIDGAAALDIIG